jgi:hypothetical protein
MPIPAVAQGAKNWEALAHPRGMRPERASAPGGVGPAAGPPSSPAARPPAGREIVRRAAGRSRFRHHHPRRMADRSRSWHRAQPQHPTPPWRGSSGDRPGRHRARSLTPGGGRRIRIPFLVFAHGTTRNRSPCLSTGPSSRVPVRVAATHRVHVVVALTLRPLGRRCLPLPLVRPVRFRRRAICLEASVRRPGATAPRRRWAAAHPICIPQLRESIRRLAACQDC